MLCQHPAARQARRKKDLRRDGCGFQPGQNGAKGMRRDGCGCLVVVPLYDEAYGTAPVNLRVLRPEGSGPRCNLHEGIETRRSWSPFFLRSTGRASKKRIRIHISSFFAVHVLTRQWKKRSRIIFLFPFVNGFSRSDDEIADLEAVDHVVRNASNSISSSLSQNRRGATVALSHSLFRVTVSPPACSFS